MNLKIINISVGLCVLIFMLFACQSDKNNLLYKKWKTVSLRNSTMDKELRDTKAYIDTLGDQDPEIRQAIDIDSAKKIFQAQIDQMLIEQKLAQDNTLMEFKSNGMAYTTSIEGVDSAMFTIEDHSIKIDEAKLKGFGETMTFEILQLTKDTLQLRVIDYGDTSVVTMVPMKLN